MKALILLITTILSALFTGCMEHDLIEPADWVFKSGTIFTSEPRAPYAEAIAVRKDRIVYVGNESGVLSYN